MHFRNKIAALLALVMLSACTPPSSSSSAAVIGGTYYAVQYEFAEFSPRPTIGISRSSSSAIPSRTWIPTRWRATSCARSCRPPSRGRRSPSPTRPRRKGRIHGVGLRTGSVNSAPDLGSYAVCNGETRTGRHDRASSMSMLSTVRNDQAMSETTAWVQATRPRTDASVECASSANCSRCVFANPRRMVAI